MDKFQWDSAVPELVPGPKFCPSAMDDYLDPTMSNREDVRTSFRQHLLYLGWEIKTRLDGKNRRFWYRSLSHETFYSLKKVGVSLKSPAAIDGKPHPSPSENPRFSLMLSKLCTPSDEVVIEPEYCPEAVHAYTSGNNDVNGRAFLMKVKQHLSAIGWSFYYTLKVGNKKELRYCSPNGKVFSNLISACKWCVETGALTLNDQDKSLLSNVVQVFKSKKQKSQSAFTSSSNRNPKTDLPLLIDNEINDDICSSCHYGGELVLCDQCPSSYHTQCLGLKEVPDGDWFCPSCCCRICGRHEKDSSLLKCTQCETKYHAECHMIKGKKKCYPQGYWFCQDTCEQIFCGLHEIMGKPISVGAGSLTWTLLKYVNSCEDEYILESYKKLKAALDVMHDCFEPNIQAATGRELVDGVIFSKWSEVKRMNYQGFYTAVLEKNKDVISAATVRIHGKRVAEVPLVATQVKYRRHGMCRFLMDALEKKLVDLGVESLVLPAVPEMLDTWINSFGFSVMSETERPKFLDCTFLEFQGTKLCHKVLKRYKSTPLVYTKRRKLTGETNRTKMIVSTSSTV